MAAEATIDMEMVLKPNPGPQTWALSCPVDEIMYGGARGGGKGIFLILDWLRHAAKCGGHARGLLVRKYLTDLADFVRESKKYLPRLGWEFKEQAKEWHGPDGSVLSLRYLEREEDAEGYQGWNLSWIAVDEAGQYKTSMAIDLLRAALRNTDAAERVLRLTCNPGGPGHRWLKARYVDAGRPMTPIKEMLRLPSGIMVPTTRVFIPARLKDNPLCNTPEYQKNLLLSAGGRAWLVKAWLEGDWNVQPDGGIFDVDKINYGPMPALLGLGAKPSPGSPVIEWTYQGWDTAFTVKTTNDESAGLTVGRDDRARFWLLNLEHGHWHTGQTPLKIIEQQRVWNARFIRVEGGPAGLALEPHIRDAIIQSMGTDSPILTDFDLVSHMTDKVAKNGAFASAVNMGQVWVPEGAAWWPYMQSQMLTFSGKDGIPDDCIDAGGVCFREADRIFKSAAISPPVPIVSPIRPDIQARIQELRARVRGQAPSDGPRTMWSRR